MTNFWALHWALQVPISVVNVVKTFESCNDWKWKKVKKTSFFMFSIFSRKTNHKIEQIFLFYLPIFNFFNFYVKVLRPKKVRNFDTDFADMKLYAVTLYCRLATVFSDAFPNWKPLFWPKKATKRILHRFMFPPFIWKLIAVLAFSIVFWKCHWLFERSVCV